jgi:hypothetical protein
VMLDQVPSLNALRASCMPSKELAQSVRIRFLGKGPGSCVFPDRGDPEASECKCGARKANSEHGDRDLQVPSNLLSMSILLSIR